MVAACSLTIHLLDGVNDLQLASVVYDLAAVPPLAISKPLGFEALRTASQGDFVFQELVSDPSVNTAYLPIKFLHCKYFGCSIKPSNHDADRHLWIAAELRIKVEEQ